MISFSKIQGTGNDFVCVDRRELLDQLDWPQIARDVCDRHFGVGADGILLLEHGELASYRMRMLNPDGSEAQMCGNGTRCIAVMLRDLGLADGAFDLEVSGRVIKIEPAAAGFRVHMGLARVIDGDRDLQYEGLHGTVVDVENPHVVIVVDNVEVVPLLDWGPAIEGSPVFPDRVNVHFVQWLSSTRSRVRTWERGAGATMACGSGACAVGRAKAAELQVGQGHFDIAMPGGLLRIEVDGDQVWMTGPAAPVFNGVWA